MEGNLSEEHLQIESLIIADKNNLENIKKRHFHDAERIYCRDDMKM